MKRAYKYLFVFLGSLFMFPLVSNAECSYERQAELSKIASNVQFSYTYDVTNGTPQFTVNITNLTNDIYVVDNKGDTFVNNEISKMYSFENKITYKIYSNDSLCRGEYLLTRYVNLPSYNSFSQTEECKQNPKFKYCSTWGSLPDSGYQFDVELESYKVQQENLEKEKQATIWQQLIEFINQNKLILLITLFAIVIVIIFIILYKRIKC